MARQYGRTTNRVHPDLVDILSTLTQLRRLAVSMEYRIPDGAEYIRALLNIKRHLGDVRGDMLYLNAQLPEERLIPAPSKSLP